MSIRTLAILLLVAAPSWAQQNLFNVPSAEITGRGEEFFQQQFNLTRAVGQSNTTFDYGLGHGSEIGFNVLDVVLYDHSGPVDSDGPAQAVEDFTLNGSHIWKFDEHRSLQLGAQAGFSPGHGPDPTRLVEFEWLNGRYALAADRGALVLGVYHGNEAYTGPGNSVGAMVGVDLTVKPKKLNFVADLITGTNDIALGVVGGVLYLPHRWQFSAGYQVPAPDSANHVGVVLEFTRQ